MLHFRKISDETELDRLLNRDFTSYRRKGFIEVGAERYCMPSIFEEESEAIANFRVRDDDVFVCGFPKSGSRWTNELVWLVMNNFDCEKSRREFIDYRCPRLETMGLYSSYSEILKDVKDIEQMPGQRCIATHLGWSLLPEDIVNEVKRPKMVVIVRNSADVCLSYYHQNRSVVDYNKTFDDFCEIFLSERLPLGPYWTHVASFLDQRHRPNILILKYEEMIIDLPSSIRKVATFLGKTVPEDRLPKICRHLSFDSMKKMESFNLQHIAKDYTSGVNPFVRAGVIGGHVKEMLPKYVKRFREMDRHHLEPKGLVFNF